MKQGTGRRVPQYRKPHDVEAWTGPVVRLADLSDAERIALGGRARDDVLPSVHLTWRCTNPFCRHWTMNGAHLTGRCNFCFERRGQTTHPQHLA